MQSCSRYARGSSLRFVLMGALLSVVLGSCGPWEKAEEFVKGLRCGMSREEVRVYAQQFEGTQVVERRAENYPPFVVVHEETRIGCWFRDDRLESVQIFWVSAPTTVSRKPVMNVCTGETQTQPKAGI